MTTITMGQPARRDTPPATLDGTARRVLQCLLAADATGGEGTVVAADMRRLRRRLDVRPSDVMLAVRALIQEMRLHTDKRYGKNRMWEWECIAYPSQHRRAAYGTVPQHDAKDTADPEPKGHTR